MAHPTLPTRALLASGVVAGPMYVTVTLIQALTRDGFDIQHHRFSWLTTGDLGWIHQSNMLLVGVLTVLLAVGVRQMLGTGRGAVWGPRLLGLFGVAYIVGGLFTADPVAGFPPGTTPQQAQERARALQQRSQNMGGCGGAAAAAREIGAEVVSNDQVRVRELPPALQGPLLSLSVGQATPPFGSEERVSVLVLCGRDEPPPVAAPNPERVMESLMEQRVNQRAQRYLRDLRRDAVIDYR